MRVGLPTMCNTESEHQDLTFEKLFVYYASKGVALNKRTFKKNLVLLTETGKYNNWLQDLLAAKSLKPKRIGHFLDVEVRAFEMLESECGCFLMEGFARDLDVEAFSFLPIGSQAGSDFLVPLVAAWKKSNHSRLIEMVVNECLAAQVPTCC